VQAVVFNVATLYSGIWYYPNCPSGISSVAITITNSNNTFGAAAQIMEFNDPAGSNLAPLDVTGTKTGTATPQAIATSGATTAASELAIVAYNGSYASATKDTLIQGAGFTHAGEYGAGVKQNSHIAFDYKLDTGATGVQTDSVTFTGPFANFDGVIATFKTFTVAPPSGLLPQQLHTRGLIHPSINRSHRATYRS
jgi:hypothetical protein